MPWCEWSLDVDDSPCWKWAEYQKLIFVPGGLRVLQVWLVCEKHSNGFASCRLDELEEETSHA